MSETPDPPAAPGHVIELDSRRTKGAKPRLAVAKEPFCFAHHFLMDRETRLVTCTKCKQAFEGFDALAYLAEHWPDFHGNRTAIAKELSTLEKERDAVKEEIKRLTGVARRRIRRIAEETPHAVRVLELVLRLQRIPRSDATYSLDRVALSELLTQIEREAKVVALVRDAKVSQ